MHGVVLASCVSGFLLGPSVLVCGVWGRVVSRVLWAVPVLRARCAAVWVPSGTLSCLCSRVVLLLGGRVCVFAFGAAGCLLCCVRVVGRRCLAVLSLLLFTFSSGALRDGWPCAFASSRWRHSAGRLGSVGPCLLLVTKVAPYNRLCL